MTGAPPPALPSGARPDDMRAAMARLPGGVAVITALTPAGHDVAAVVTSLVSVSLEPPRLLVVLHGDGRLTPLLQTERVWAVSVPSDARQVTLLSEPGRPDMGQFSGIPHRRGEHGAALLRDAAAWLECRTARTHESGDHLIVVADVLAATVGEPAAGALVHRLSRVRPT